MNKTNKIMLNDLQKIADTVIKGNDLTDLFFEIEREVEVEVTEEDIKTAEKMIEFFGPKKEVK